MEKVKLSIVIPVYNEEKTILEIISSVKAQPYEKEIIVVDDGSTDKTAELLSAQNDPAIKIISYKPNRGKGYALRQAFQKATGDIVIIQDADLEYYPDEYGLLIEKIVQDKADAVYGTRFVGSHRVFYFYHFLGNFILNMAANVILNTTLSDLMTGAKAFRAPVIKSLKLCANRFGIEVEMTAEIFRRKYRVYEVPISYSGRTYEEGKKITWVDFFKCLAWLMRASMRKI
jgi:glycosyltransferase involved in cell wall biosynthesis